MTGTDSTAGGNETEEDQETEQPDLPAGLPDRVRVAGVLIRLRNFLTAEDDATVGRVSFLSRPREWHAAGVGYIVMVVASISLALGLDPAAAISAVTGTGVITSRMWSRFSRSGHVKDALAEPAYAALGAVLGVLPAVGFVAHRTVRQVVSWL